jgi:GntR family transcriptional regulator / MocR family aminotransferase
VDFYIPLDRGSRIPLHTQLEDRVRAAIRTGQLDAGTELPSTRSLAGELSLSRGVVVEAYSQLRAEGYLEIGARGKTRIATSANVRARASAQPADDAATIAYDFHPGLPDLIGFPRAGWARAVRKAVGNLPATGLAYEGLSGAVELREALAAHLSRARGAVASADRILITQGFTEGLALSCQALRSRGARRLAVEEPCLHTQRAVIEDAGLEPVSIPVDEDGMRVAELERRGVDAALLTPAHQFPMGAVLAPDRRRQLIDWARKKGAYVIEDDYDAEYRYDRDPVGTLQGLAPEHVIYGGSASKTLAPALRLGWLLVPEELFASVLERKALAGRSPILDQLALADWISSGELHRHLRRMRLRYRERRKAMLDALRTHLPNADLQGIAAGLHVVARLPTEIDEARLVAAAAERGVNVHSLGRYRAKPAPKQPGLVLGYASQSESSIARGIREIARAVESTCKITNLRASKW